ncbi:MAG: choice-of-anchor D domain-containing protein, partial [Nitrospirae bacterium]|nr:choice-of-anchor D domain-containing protein [Nitrospirota bacterium]
PSGIDCGNTCSTTFNYGTSVTLSTAPDSNIIFNGWSGGGCSGTGACTVSLTANTVITPDFEAPRISVAPSSNDYGSVNMAQSSAAQAFIITNSGAAPLMISGAVLTGPNTTDFSVTSDTCSNATLQSNGTCEVDVIFNPATAGIKFAKVTVSSDDPSTPTFDITLNGTGVQTYTITPSAGSGGNISPNTAKTVTSGSTTSFTVTPNTGYSISSVTGCGGTLSGNTYTTGAVTSNCTVAATFTLSTYTITATAGANGSISPSGATTVNYGGSQTYTITPSAGYSLAGVQVDGASVGAVTTYTFSNVTANHTISATFASNTYTVTPSAGANGSISPSTPQTVSYNGTVSFTVTPNAGYSIGSVTGCGGTLSGSTYTTGPITSACAVTASFTITTYTITATAGSNGSITPAGSTTVNSGGSQTYTITPNTGYRIYDVQVDGASVGAVTTYPFNSVTASHTIAVTFAINTYPITAYASANGSISPSGSTNINYGSSQTYTISPAAGYRVSDVQVDGLSIGAATVYTFSNVTANHSISASFASQPVKRLSGSAITYYSTLQDAYNAAIDGDIIQAQAGTLSGNLTVNNNVSITIQGGYNGDFTSNAGNITTIVGQFQTTSGGGAVTASNFKLSQ